MNDFECPRCGHCCHVEEEHMSRKAMQVALEALESDPISHAGIVSRKQAITALRQALVDADDTSQKRVDEKAKREHEWVGLHGSEVPDTYKYDVMFMEGWLWAEERLKEKNHG